MVTTSTHKPGWRSRRRSRLSLVERAVPRLGRLPGDDDGFRLPRPTETKPLLPSISSPPLISSRDKAAEDGPKPASAKSPSIEPAAAEPASAEPTAEDSRRTNDGKGADTDALTRDHANVTPAETSLCTPETAPADPADQPPSEDAGAVADDETPPSRPLDDVLELSGAKPTPSSKPKDRPTDASPIDEIELDGRGLETTIESADTIEFVSSDGDAMGVGIAVSDLATTAVAGPVLSLDWNRLIESGFLDPRNRNQPLPANMDEIVRALIRQALSDQSSWRDRVILVTSPSERTSKTSAAINFAFGLTTVANHHAVLVEVDMSGAGAVDRLGGGDHPGIAAALADEAMQLDDLAITTDLDRLTLVASGEADEDTLDRFASRRMLQILRQLTENPDTILVIDAPPILISQEAAVLSVISGQVVLAVEAGRTTADQIEQALKRIGDRHNVSLVLNESSGVVGGETSSAGRRSPKTETRSSMGGKRRLSKAAAFASMIALGLLLPQDDGLAGPPSQQGIMPAPELAGPTAQATPHERWSSRMETLKSACRRNCW